MGDVATLLSRLSLLHEDEDDGSEREEAEQEREQAGQEPQDRRGGRPIAAPEQAMPLLGRQVHSGPPFWQFWAHLEHATDCLQGEHTLTIGNQRFAGVSAVWDHIAAVKQRLLGLHIEEGHPDFRQFTAQRNVGGKGIEFRFVNSAGETHDFSAKKCMEQRDEPAGAKLAHAMRQAVQDQIVRFKRGSAGQGCQLCGTHVSDAGSPLVADHSDPTMPQLRRSFLQSCAIKAPCEFGEAPRGGACLRPEDGGFEREWQQYHRSQARLRLLCERCLLQENARRDISAGGRGRGGRGGRGRSATGRGGRGRQ